MSETPEGIGGRKWSYQIYEQDDPQVTEKWLELSEGKHVLARLTKAGEPVKALLVTAPQLWDAANSVMKTLKRVNDTEQKEPGAPDTLDLDRIQRHAKAEQDYWSALGILGNMVAKAVGKTDWKDVSQ